MRIGGFLTGLAVVALAVASPARAAGQLADGLIADRVGTFHGDGEYSIVSTPEQRQTIHIKRGDAKAVEFAVQNDGSATATFVVSAPAAPRWMHLSYWDATTRITDAIVGGTYTVTLDPGATKVLHFGSHVFRSATAGSSVRLNIDFRDQADPGPTDRVTALIVAT